MALVDLLDLYPKIQRPIEQRSQASEEDRILARKFGKEYFDGTRQQGYGGYYYDGRWKPIVRRFQEYYKLANNSRILDVGCAKGFMLHDFQEAMPEATVAGLDISEYVLTNSMPSVKPFLVQGTANELPFPDKSFDLVISIATIHNLDLDGVKMALRELERVSSAHKWIKLGAYNTPEEKEQLDKWNVVAKTFMYCNEWIELFDEVGYTGDYTWFLP